MTKKIVASFVVLGVFALAALAGSEGRAAADGHPHGPPPEAYTACESKAAGDACTVAFGDKSIDGTCVAAPSDASDQRISCRPSKMPPRP